MKVDIGCLRLGGYRCSQGSRACCGENFVTRPVHIMTLRLFPWYLSCIFYWFIVSA